MRWILHSAIFLFLTALTLVGGLAWLAAVWTGRKALGFPLIYGCLWLLTVWAAPLAGREPLPCFGDTLRMQSPFYCITLRHFVDQEITQVATRAAGAVKAQHPDTVTLALDGGGPSRAYRFCRTCPMTTARNWILRSTTRISRAFT